MAFDGELRSCLAEILGESPPPVEGDALVFCRQWRNLGLVPMQARGICAEAMPPRWPEARAAESP